MNRRTFSLACIFGVVTCCALMLTAGRVFGYVAVGALLVAPWPVIGYVHFVRGVMIRTQADFQTRSHVVNVMCVAGLILAVIVTTTLIGAGITYLKQKPSLLTPESYWGEPK